MPSPRRAAVVLAALALSACTSPAPSVDDIEAEYGDITEELATSTGLPIVENDDAPGLDTVDGRCTYFSPTIDLEQTSGFRVSSVQEEVDAVLLEHGFADSSEYAAPGGWEGLRSEDDRGATITILGDGSAVRVAVTVPVDTGDAPCEDSTIG